MTAASMALVVTLLVWCVWCEVRIARLERLASSLGALGDLLRNAEQVIARMQKEIRTAIGEAIDKAGPDVAEFMRRERGGTP